MAAALVTGPAIAAGPAASSRLILLGTAGGPTPKPNRAASAQVVVVGDAAYVIDCGNGVARQLVLAGIKLKALRSIFITHHHSDHVVDYGALVMLAWASDLATPIDSYGPPPLVDMTRGFLDVNRVDIAVRTADEGRPPLADLIRPHEITRAGPVMADANVRVTAALVEHPPLVPSLAYRFDCPDRSIVISGDTRPSEALVALAKGADILVHEVMYLPALEALIASEPNAPTLREHLLASHTSAADVGKVATRAGVKTLVLSHFVPGGFPFVTDEQWHDAVRPHFAGKIVVGRDLMVL
jgi:ribonuclease BN (tRNA processing enzyme)